MLLPNHQRVTYNAETLDSLCSEFRIPPELRDTLHRDLEGSVAQIP